MKRLLVELRERGYQHDETIVYEYLRTLRQQPEGMSASVLLKKAAVRSAAQTALSEREAAWLFVCDPQKLRISQVVHLDHLRVANEDLESVYQLAQDFRVMVTKRHVHVLGRWLHEDRDGQHQIRGYHSDAHGQPGGVGDGGWADDKD